MPNLSQHQLANDTVRFRFRLLFSQHKIGSWLFLVQQLQESFFPIMVVIISTTSEHWVKIYDAERDSINFTVNDINGMVIIPKHLQTIFASARDVWRRIDATASRSLKSVKQGGSILEDRFVAINKLSSKPHDILNGGGRRF